MHLDDSGRCHGEGMSGHGDGHVEAAGADRDHAQGSCGGGVAVGAEQRLARPSETLEVEVVTDPVAWARVPDPMPGREALQEPVVVRVLEIDLQDVVVDVHHGERKLDPLQAQLLELQAGHGPGCVLHQSLVQPDADFLAGFERAANLMCLEGLTGEVLSQWPAFARARDLVEVAVERRYPLAAADEQGDDHPYDLWPFQLVGCFYGRTGALVA